MELSEMTDVAAILKGWEDEQNQANYNPVPTLTRLAEIIEVETDNYLKMDPDPFDERHPSRADPDCQLGHILKVLFKKDNFMTKLVNDYLRDTYWSRLGITGRDVNKLNIAACRLMLDIMPGLETSAVFQPDMDGLIQRLIKWATNSLEPLQTYSTGLLAAAMEVPEIATRFRDQNSRMVPLMLKRLRQLQNTRDTSHDSSVSRPFAHLAVNANEEIKKSASENPSESPKHKTPTTPQENGFMSPPHLLSPTMPTEHEFQTPNKVENTSDTEPGSARKKLRLDSESPQSNHNQNLYGPNRTNTNISMCETSNSSWAELESYVIGSIQMFPPTHSTRQMLILRYLTPMGEYQEFLSHVFENRALELILGYVNVRETKDSRLAFEALKYLAALLCHKKFSIEFINVNGLQKLLEVPRPSVAATGVSICLYYLAYCEDAMERVCTLPHSVVKDLVKYGLWLLECSHDSGRCHATMFFGLTFQFKIILEEFDQQDGLRKMLNVISTLPILSVEEDYTINDDAECAARQIVRHVCVALKRYLDAHLVLKVEHLRNAHLRQDDRNQSNIKAYKLRPEEVQEQIETLYQLLPFRSHWFPVDELLKHGGITLLLQIIAFAYEWNYSGRAETVRSALDILAISSVMPKVQLLFCDKIYLPEEPITVGMNIILGAAEGEIVADPDVQKAALSVIVNCACAPIQRLGGSASRFSLASGSPSKKTKVKSSEELIQKVWESVRSNNGIMVLLQLMNVKTPITDADSMRTLACRALAGLARSDTVRQIVSKLPLFTNGQLQNLMRDPILQEKRQEHVSFQKYALELMERLSGKTKHTGNELEVSLANIHRANVVAQTKIQFNDRQLLQLVHQHLQSRGLTESASILQKEANLSTASTNLSLVNTPTPFRYIDRAAANRPRLSVGSTHHHRTGSSQGLSNSKSLEVPNSSPAILNGTNTPQAPTNIKITRKSICNTSLVSTPQNSRLQKQIAFEPKCASQASLVHQEDTEEPRITLDSIITEYLTNQHALCKNPMATCPQFNLFVPHKCPDPKPRLTSAYNFTTRVCKRAIGYQSRALDRRLIHSKFCPVQCIRMPTDDGFFTCARFMPGNQIIVGDYSGEVKIFNIHSGAEESVSIQCHDSYIVHIEPNKTGSLIITSSTWGRPLSSLWNNNFIIQQSFEEEEYIEFSKLTQDRIIGTKGESATIYDVTTGTQLAKLTPTISNQYTKNKATFSPTDELVLSDGVLWDVNSNQQIHKLDKLNQTQSGVFHPNGLEIVSNTEVWDLRTFHLLKTVPALNQSQVYFSPVNNAIYSIALEQENDDDTTFDSSFKTLDASDYSSIATIDVKRNIYDLCVNSFDSQIAIVENQGLYHSIQESVVRIYDVGRRRDDEDEQEEDDEEEDMDGSEDDSGSNRGSDDNDANAGGNDIAENNSDNDDDAQSQQSDDLSWTDISDVDPNYDPNNTSDSDLSTLEDLFF